jgi:limonene-1,2-epoxide hydrolase
MKAQQSQIAILYLKAWSEKDIETIESMLSDTIELTDWEGSIAGRAQVIAFNRQLFSKLNHVRLDIERIAIGQDTVIAEITITLDAQVSIHVVDVLEFDGNKIKQIRAYKR